MSKQERKEISFDPNHRLFRRKLWARVRTKEGTQVFIIWARVWKVAVLLLLIGWLSLATTAWLFVKHRRGVADAQFVDLAFYPVRADHYRETLSRHYLAIAQKQLEKGQFTPAITNLRLAVGKYDKNQEARLILVNLYSQVDRSDLSVTLMEAGLPYANQDLTYIRQLFSLLRGLNRNERIIELGRELLPSQPDKLAHNVEIVQQIAEAHLRSGRNPEAKRWLENWGLEDSLKGSLLLAEIEVNSGFQELALLRLEALMKKYPNAEQVRISLIKEYRRANRLDQARRIAFERMLEHPNSAGAHLDFVVLAHEIDDSATMNREFDSYLKQFGTDQRALLMMASATIGFNRPDLTRRIRDQAPTNPEGFPPPNLQFTLAYAECLSGHYADALNTASSLDGYKGVSKEISRRLNLLRTWASFGLKRSVEGESWLKLYLLENSQDMLLEGLELADRLQALNYPDTVHRLLSSLVDQFKGHPRPLVALIIHDLAHQQWTGIIERLPELMALDPRPEDLIQTLRDLDRQNMNLSEDLRDRMAHLLNVAPESKRPQLLQPILETN